MLKGHLPRGRGGEEEFVDVDERQPPRLPLVLRNTPERVFNVVLQKSIPAQIRQLILYISNNKG